MGMGAGRLNLRLLIDGIEVPIIGARCTSSEGAPATAEIQVVATDEVYDIEPRAEVEVYYYDTYDYAVDPRGETIIRLSPYDIRRWKLLFAGEFIAINFSKQANNRSCTLFCVDPTNYWDFIKQHYINFKNGGVELFENAFMGVKLDRVKNFDVVGKDVHSNLYVWLTQTKGSDGKPNLYLGMQRVLREMFFASNDFYARAFNRMRLGDQIVGLPNDQTAAKLLQLQFFEKFIKNQIGGAGGMVTARQMVDLLLGPVFHTYVTVLAPYFDRTGAARGFTPSSSNPQDEDLRSETIDRTGSWPNATLNYTVVKPDTWFLAPPVCNVVFPHQYNQLSFERNYLQEPTRLFLRSSLIFTGTDKWLTERFYAPDFEAFNGLLEQNGGYLERLSKVLLPHEVFTGLNPAETWQPDLQAYVQKGPRREYLARLTDYLFWKMRFATRSANVSGPFNPNLIAGYPALVMDRVANPGHLTRHYLGNIQTLVHSVDQNGGWTHFTLAGARVHDETADFDLKGRSLEEVTSRGTDGFLDDRYDIERIGKEVYQVLFGCGSISDAVDIESNVTLPDGADLATLSFEQLAAVVKESKGQMAAAVAVWQRMYQVAVQNGVDIHAFTQSVTNRPKANMLEMLGSDFEIHGSSGQNDTPFTAQALEKALREDPDLAQEGFFATCNNPDAAVTKDATFVAVARREVTTVTYKDVAEVTGDLPTTGVTVVAAAERVAQVTTKVVSTKTKGSYDLASLLEARRGKVQAYVDSLKFRGMRG